MAVSISGTNGVTFPDSSLQAAAASPYVLKNRIINGAMVVDQRNAGALVTGAAGEIYGVDRFITGVFGSGTGRISAQQSSTAPTGFVNSLINTVTTADAAPSANYGYGVIQRIEGYNIADLGWGTASPQTITVSFWARNSLTGTYSISVANSAITWAYTTTYTISTANTWEYKTVTFTGPTSGTWLTTNGVGIGLIFGLGGGSNRQATLNAWYAPTGTNTPTDASGCVDWIATNGATFYITGVQLEQNTSATPFERRLYNQELANCQRYYQQSSFYTGYATSTTSVRAIFPQIVSLRASPTPSIATNASSLSNPLGTNGTPSTISVYNWDSNGLIITVNSSVTMTGATAGASINNAGALTTMSSEL